MSDYRFGQERQVGEADNLLAQTVRVTLNDFPVFARVFVRLFPINGIAFDIELEAAGTYNFLSVSGARIFVEPEYNAAYDGGSISGSVRAFTALLLEIESDTFSDTISVIPDPAFPLDIIGTMGNDVLQGDANDNRILGLGGDDLFKSSLGGDTYNGGDGADMIDYSLSNASVTLTIGGSVTGGHATGDTLIGVESAIGSAFGDSLTGNGLGNILNGGAGNDNVIGLDGDDVLIGGLGADSLDGGLGNDILDGSGGIDSLIGGSGDDIYVVDSAQDFITEVVNGGNDVVLAYASYALNDESHVETVAAYAASAIDLTGSMINNTLVGNDFANMLDGRSGADLLQGFGGNDVLQGGSGIDILDGGLGSDVLDGGSGGDVLIGGLGSDVYVVDNIGDIVVEAVDAGSDLILTFVDYTISADSAVEIIAAYGSAVNLGGSDGGNTLVGNELMNTLRGNGGDDLLQGQGADDVLLGGAGKDKLDGGDGNDVLDGGVEADVMGGRTGNDVYIVDDANDVVVEQFNEGSDVVIAYVSHTLLAQDMGVETVAAYGSAVSLTGSSIGNVLVGNELDNILSGLGGNDLLQGNAGADTLIGGDGDDELDGGDAVDTLDGGVGNDRLDGSAGADQLTGGAGADNFVFTSALGSGVDSILDFTSGSDRIALDDAIFTALAPGGVSAAQFTTGVATTAEHRILFDTNTGTLSYDADGSGSGAAVAFAMLSPGALVVPTDLVVI